MFANLLGNSIIGLYVCSADLSFLSDFEVDSCDLMMKTGHLKQTLVVQTSVDWILEQLKPGYLLVF